MAENTVLNLGSGGDLIATDELTTLNGVAAAAGLKVQRVKVGFGTDNILRDVDAANGLPVVGTFFQATQPVSLTSTTITGTVAATKSGAYPVDTAAKGTTTAGNVTSEATDANTQSLHARVTNASLAVTGTFFQATQPVSAVSLPLPAGAATETTLAALNTKVTAVNTGAVVLAAGAATIGALVANQSVNNAQIAGVATATGSGVSGTGVQRVVLATDVVQPAVSEIRAATLHVSITAAVNTAVTASLPAPAAGLFHYITSVELVKLYSVLGVASGAGVVITSTNLPGSPAWLTQQAAGAVGTAVEVIKYNPTTPLKSAAAAIATTFVAPAQLQTIWRWNVSYFTAA